MIYGTHNSLTSYNAYGMCKLYGFIGNIFSRCQKKAIEEQYESGIRWFNFQINMVDGKWVGSHGTMLYDVDVLEKLKWLNSQDETVYVQLSLDKNFFIRYDRELANEYKKLVYTVEDTLMNLVIESVANEYTDKIEYHCRLEGTSVEVYWSMSWAKSKLPKFWYLIPIPCLWSKVATEKIDLSDDNIRYMIDFA